MSPYEFQSKDLCKPTKDLQPTQKQLLGFFSLYVALYLHYLPRALLSKNAIGLSALNYCTTKHLLDEL